MEALRTDLQVCENIPRQCLSLQRGGEKFEGPPEPIMDATALYPEASVTG